MMNDNTMAKSLEPLLGGIAVSMRDSKLKDIGNGLYQALLQFHKAKVS
jgi:hypothetical protein